MHGPERSCSEHSEQNDGKCKPLPTFRFSKHLWIFRGNHCRYFQAELWEARIVSRLGISRNMYVLAHCGASPIQEEARQVLAVFAEKITQCSGEIGAQQVCNRYVASVRQVGRRCATCGQRVRQVCSSSAASLQ